MNTSGFGCVWKMAIYSFFIWVLVVVVQSNSLQPEKCQEPPKEKHCLIEYSVRHRWPHSIRYVYNWYTHSCFEIRWSHHCPPAPEPALSNNFRSEPECFHECEGWA